MVGYKGQRWMKSHCSKSHSRCPYTEKLHFWDIKPFITDLSSLQSDQVFSSKSSLEYETFKWKVEMKY